MKKAFKFTEERVNNLPTNGKKQRFKDDDINGFVVIVSEKGHKTYNVYKRARRGASAVTVKIGNVGEISLKDAREQALIVLSNLTLGVNPNQQFTERNQAGLTLKKALSEYIDSKEGKIAANTLIQYRSVLENYSPHLLHRKLKDIARADIKQVHAKITKGECSWTQSNGTVYKMKKPSPTQADLWGGTLRAIYNFAIEAWRGANDEVLILSNPVMVLSALKLWNKVPSKVTRISEAQLSHFFDTLDLFRATPRLPTELAIADALEIAVFTGLRLNEIMYLKKDNINFDTNTFWINKTKNGEVLELPLTNSVRSVFERRHLAVSANSEYLFPSKCETKPIQDPKKTIANLKKLSTNESDEELNMNFHDMRRTFSSIAESVGVGTYMIKRLVNHKMGESWDVTEKYMHFSASDLSRFSVALN
ncbi:hypothetical protein BCV02_16545 [Vibrio breoganii]|uniref:tyrosine-type recombinase/integrase n=1 Tax=Vibrio breoganii TaxID=553239 RepID=UPI000CC84558|nr:integrase family protein [Vibrio breoganii]PMF98851.1 hypothetical protein BCV02_16545 [Vibrio breoganii]PMG92161.1 hypothetical protein BCU80_11475 [Vibrio breoganii]PMK16188.1 hypothetical protein BCU06_12690 [Vibrio breoganii]PMK29389.1 hypothetical protein BCU03_11175 [Vibrio breoganii]PML19931.1 hypothetical protein BCT84_00535 [Vibrio breoganii]